MTCSRHPWIDPELRPGLEHMPPELAQLGEAGEPGIYALRELMAGTLPNDEQLSHEGALTVSKQVVESTGGHVVELLVLRPTGVDGPIPAIYFVHPSGMVIPSNRMGLEKPATWAIEFGVAVVSVDYRVAPEARDATPVEDSYAGLDYTAKHVSELGIDATRLLLVGISGGGGVGAGTVLMARDRGGPAISHQMLLCPMLDDRGVTPSSAFEDLPWDGPANAVGWRALLGDAKGGAGVSEYAAPARAADLRGLPPTYIDVGASEVFRDESMAYASALAAAGVPVELHVFMGGFHGYEGSVPTAEVSQATVDARESFLRRVFGRTRTITFR